MGSEMMIQVWVSNKVKRTERHLDLVKEVEIHLTLVAVNYDCSQDLVIELLP